MELKFRKGYGYWDLTKYPYGGDFNRFDDNEIGYMIKGPVKMGSEIRVKLNDNRIIVVDAHAVANVYFDTVINEFKNLNNCKI